MIYIQIDIRIIKFDFFTIFIKQIYDYIPPREFIIIERKGKLQNCKKSTSIIKPSIERVFSDLPMVFADR